jgi:hypothetical protein
MTEILLLVSPSQSPIKSERFGWIGDDEFVPWRHGPDPAP